MRRLGVPRKKSIWLSESSAESGHLNGYRGILQVDGYAPTTRRKFYELQETIRSKSPDARVAARQEASEAIVANLFALWQKTLDAVELRPLNGLSLALTADRRFAS